VTEGTHVKRAHCDNNDSKIEPATIRSASVLILRSVMICGLSTISLVLGTAIASLANEYPKYQATMETVAGFLLIGGLGMLGYAVEAFIGHP
jgi:hypothetical protein